MNLTKSLGIARNCLVDSEFCVDSTICRAGGTPNARLAEAIDLVASKRTADGRWPLENVHAGQLDVADAEPSVAEGRPSRWNTRRALHVLEWYSA